MVSASRSRSVLSPLPQNHFGSASTASQTITSLKQDNAVSNPPRTRRSQLKTKLAQASSALLRSPTLIQQAACFVDIDVDGNRFGNTIMEPSKARAGQKRKKGNTGGKSNGDGSNDAGTGSRTSRTLAGLSHRRSVPKEKTANIVSSPHLPREKPSSSASDRSEWSSLSSLSPSTSRSLSFVEMDEGDGERESPAGRRPSPPARRSSRGSLQRGMLGMTLEDRPRNGRAASDNLSNRRGLSRSQSRRGSRNASREVHMPHQPSHPRRTASETMVLDSGAHNRSGQEQDDSETEKDRLIAYAPTWQLHRLKKEDLVALNLVAGAWEQSPSEAELEELTKPDLVNKIITCRSRLDRTQAELPISSSSSHVRALESESEEEEEEAIAADRENLPGKQERRNEPGLSGNRITRSGAGRIGQIRSASEHITSNSNQDESDDSNEGGGEETEAEPSRLSLAKQRGSRGSKRPGMLRRMDSSTFDDMEPIKPAKFIHQLRDGSNMKIGAARRMRHANGSEALSASSSSIFGGGRSSRASMASQSTFLQNYQRSLFVASSPIRTRSRTRNSLGIPSRRRAVTRALAAADETDGDHEQRRDRDDGDHIRKTDRMGTPRLTRRRQQKNKFVKFNTGTPSNRGTGESEMDNDEWMQDLSTDSEAVAAVLNGDRRGKHKSLQEPDVEAGSGRLQDVDCGSHRRTTRRASRSQQRSSVHLDTASSADQRSDTTSVELLLIPDPADEKVDGLQTSEDEQESPIKFRKLRNGKVRMIVASSSNNSITGLQGEPDEDVEMKSANESGDGDDTITAAQNDDKEDQSDEDDSTVEGLEEAMEQPTASSLARLRKSELEELCQNRRIVVVSDDKKADLIQNLLAWYDQQSHQHNEGGLLLNEDDDEDETARSDVSTATATQKMEHSSKTKGRKGRRSADTESDLPLMLLAKGNGVHSHKLPTPPLTSHNEEANAPHVGDGVDELNGLDLESLNLTDKEIPPSKLEKLDKIGSGGFKDVYVGKYHISKTRVNKVAIADIRDQLTEMDIKELSLLRDLRHENIVRFIGVSIPEDPRHVPCMIVSELCSNGDLFDYIRNTSAPNDAEVFRILLETARGLEYLHTRSPPIVHRDCKSTNVLITRRRTAKINDFGLARVKNTSRSMMRSLVGTVNWQAVELWVPKPHYNEKVDVWSAAMTFWETLQWHQPEKKYPFQGMNEHQIYLDVGQKKKRPNTAPIRKQFGAEIVDLLDRMWDHTPKNRPSMTQVCNELEDLIKLKRNAAKNKS